MCIQSYCVYIYIYVHTCDTIMAVGTGGCEVVERPRAALGLRRVARRRILYDVVLDYIILYNVM